MAIATWSHIMMRPIEPNEHMYVAASVLAMEHKIYSDFPFIQTPNLPLVYSMLYRWTGTEHYLFVARIATWFATMMTCVVMGAIAWRFSSSNQGYQAALAAWVLALSESFILITGECSNYVFPILFSLIAFWALLALPIRVGSGLAGFTLALAIGFKLYYASLVPLFAIAVFILSKDQSRRWLNVVVYLVGGVIGSVPSIVCFIRNFESFLFNNVGFHLQTAKWYNDIHYHDRLLLFDKARYAKSCLQHPSQMWILFGIVAVLVQFARRDFRDGRWVAFAWSLVCMSIVTVLIPTPIWPQYVGMIIPFALVLVLTASSDRSSMIEQTLLVCFLVGAIVSGPYYLRTMTQARQTKNWVPLAYHEEARAAMSSLSLKANVTIASFATLFVLESGYRVEPEFATARFVYQISDGLSDEFATMIHTTSKSRIDAFLDSKRPDVIVTPRSRASPGNAPPPDDDLDRYAKERGYKTHPNSSSEFNIWRLVEEDQ
jgi:hypothetical protein